MQKLYMTLHNVPKVYVTCTINTVVCDKVILKKYNLWRMLLKKKVNRKWIMEKFPYKGKRKD